MKKTMILLIAINLWSCGKTKLDKSESSTSGLTGYYICSQVPDCVKSCGPAPTCCTAGQDIWSDIHTHDACMKKSIQVANGTIVNVAK